MNIIYLEGNHDYALEGWDNASAVKKSDIKYVDKMERQLMMEKIWETIDKLQDKRW